MTNENSCRAMIASTVEAFGRLDILVNNAGIFLGGRPEEMDLVDWNKVFATNLTGAFVASQTAYPHMKRQGGGKIINIASVMSNFATGQGQAYGASKAALVQPSRSLAVAWATDNIQVNSVLPGFIDTEMTRRGREAIPELNDVVMRRTPAGRWGTPRDLAGVRGFFSERCLKFRDWLRYYCRWRMGSPGLIPRRGTSLQSEMASGVTEAPAIASATASVGSFQPMSHRHTTAT